MTRLSGSHILLTGAASGLGRLLALGAAARGARLSLLDRDEAGLAQVLAELAGKGHDAAGFTVDLADRGALQAAAAEAIASRGPVDILINNAGVVSGKPLLACPDEAIARTFQVNALAPIWLVRAVLPEMLKAGRGHLVTIASAGGLVGTSRLADYCASKFAAVGFDEAMRLEFKRMGQPIRTTVVCPFYIDTGMFKGVRTRFPWLLPILKPSYVAERVLEAIARDRARLALPRFVSLVPVARLLPPALFDGVMGFFGVNKSMDEFTGR